MRLPSEVRAAAIAGLGGEGVTREFTWLSWAVTVWRLEDESGAVYIKRAADLADERARMDWLAGRVPVPEVIDLLHVEGSDWLLTRGLRGVPLSDRSLGWKPSRIARLFGEILRDLHATDAEGCPFGEAKTGHVLTHGDYCLPNVLVEDGRLSGFVDLGLAGLADSRVDLAAGVWTLDYNFGHGYGREFLDAYGEAPISDQAIERLRRLYRND